MRIKLSDHFSFSKLIKFTLSPILMMIFTSIYNVVDGFFISNYAGKIPFAAVNLIMPFLMILGTVGFMLGSGGSAICAKTYGEGDKQGCNSYFSFFVYVAIAIGIVLSVLGNIFLRSIAYFLGARDILLNACVQYGRIVLLSLPFFMLQVMFQSFFVVAEKPRHGLFVTLLSGITNIILDATLVTLLPYNYKLMGAAIATSVSQLIGGVIPLFYFARKNDSLLHLGKTRFNVKVLLRACVNGSSEFMSNISMSIVGIMYNARLMMYEGENGVAAYGVMMYVSMIFCMSFIGYSMGVAPIISYHDGAKNYDELKNLLKKSLIIVGVGGVCLSSVAELFASPLSHVFVGYDSELFALTVSGFRIFALSFCFMGVAIFSSGFFTALNDGVTSAVISFLRTLVFQCVFIIFMPMLWGIKGVWISVVAAEFMAVVIGCLFLVVKRKKFKY
ncbi:MAG: MATE family efflux transporter [Sphaerochaetaceae bacterium]|nr:MATE family efflux transporter [Sphaerochaetaceae bacterium]